MPHPWIAAVSAALEARIEAVGAARARAAKRLRAELEHALEEQRRTTRVVERLEQLRTSVTRYRPTEITEFGLAGGRVLGATSAAAAHREALEALLTHLDGERAWLEATRQALEQEVAAPPAGEVASAGSEQTGEELRRTLAQRMHDGPVQSLNSIAFRCMLIERLLEADAGAARAEAQRMRAEVERAIETARVLATDLYPLVLEDLGLVAALRLIAAEDGGREGALELRIQGRERRLSAAHETALYWAAREALGALRAAGQRPALIEVAFEAEQVSVSVSAEGRGAADARTWSAVDAPGLARTRARLAKVGGRLTGSGSWGGRSEVRAEIAEAPC